MFLAPLLNFFGGQNVACKVLVAKSGQLLSQNWALWTHDGARFCIKETESNLRARKPNMVSWKITMCKERYILKSLLYDVWNTKLVCGGVFFCFQIGLWYWLLVVLFEGSNHVFFKQKDCYMMLQIMSFFGEGGIQWTEMLNLLLIVAWAHWNLSRQFGVRKNFGLWWDDLYMTQETQQYATVLNMTSMLNVIMVSVSGMAWHGCEISWIMAYRP